MGRWPVVEKKKNLSNAAKQKVFAIHSKLIAIAAAKGADPDKNVALYEAIVKARKENVPNDNIERAIKRGSGDDKGSEQIFQIVYEGYGVGGVAMMVTCLTDNKNRTAPNIRHIFTKYGGNMGEVGSVGFLFDRKGVLYFSLEQYGAEQLEELVFEVDAEDYIVEDGLFKIFTTVENFLPTQAFFSAKRFNFEYSWISFIPNTDARVEEFEKALKLVKMLDAFEDDEDVENITTNMTIDPKLEEEVREFIEKNTFHT